MVQETKRVTTLGPQDAASVFSATVPLEELPCVLSRAMTDVKEDQGREAVISRAHLHSPVCRESKW